MLPSTADLEAYKRDVVEVVVKRDLATATEFGIRLNRIISEFDRRADHLTAAQHERLATAHEYVRLMMNCPRRMRLDDVWPNDFVVAARAATDALLSMVQVEESGH